MAESIEVWNLADDKLLNQCRFEAFRGSGPGGQNRNKTSTAVRILHEPTGITAQAMESRSLRENKIHALRRLRHKLALEGPRRDVDPLTFRVPGWMEEYVGLKLHISTKNPRFPDAMAIVLDVLKAGGWDVPRAAVNLGVTTSALVRFLASESGLWAKVNQTRVGLGMKPLTPR
jgi:hypothetical protein